MVTLRAVDYSHTPLHHVLTMRIADAQQVRDEGTFRIGEIRAEMVNDELVTVWLPAGYALERDPNSVRIVGGNYRWNATPGDLAAFAFAVQRAKEDAHVCGN